METDIIISSEEEYFLSETYSKSQALSQAMFSMSLLANKIFVIGLSKMERMGDAIIASMSISELRERLGRKNGSFYDQLKICADDMQKHKIVYEGLDDHGHKAFQSSLIAPDCTFANGKFTIYFNKNLEKELFAGKNFTTYLLTTSLKFNKSQYAFRIHEVLKAKHDHDVAVFGKEVTVKAIYNLIQFKFIIGLYKQTPRIAREIQDRKKTFEQIEEMLPEESRKLQRWTDFKTVVLKPSLDEIREVTDFDITFKPIRTGRGGKITSLEFIIKKDISKHDSGSDDVVPDNANPSDNQEQGHVSIKTEETDYEELKSELKSFIAEPLRDKDLMVLLKDAGNDIGKIKAAYKLLEEQGHVPNIVGWLRKAIQEDYAGGIIKKQSTKKNSFKNFHERDYDFKELEKKFARN